MRTVASSRRRLKLTLPTVTATAMRRRLVSDPQRPSQPPRTKSSIRVDEQKLEAQPSTTGVVIELADKEKRATYKKIRTEVLQHIHLFKVDLSVYNAFGKEHWKVLLSQMKNDGDYTHQLFVGQSRVSQSWRYETLVKARVKLEIGIIRPNVNVGGQALGETTAMAARSAIEVAKRVTSTHTIRISVDVAANDVAVGQVVSTLEAFQGGVTPIIPSSLTSYFAVGNPSKAQNLVICDYERSAMKIMAKSYDYETAKKLAAELKDKHDLSADFPRKTATKHPLNSPTQMRSIGCACFPGMICMPRFRPLWTRIATI